jgi:D-glycero-D-manno-heptose 1,7-bisphosphate phosphatase
MKHAAVFIDRDGTLIRDVGYLSRVQQIEVLPRVTEGLALLRAHGFKIVLITNQSAVGRGFLTEGELHLIHDELQRRVGAFDGVYYCPHHPTAAIGIYRIVCDCRKPARGMVERASLDLNLDLKASYVIGDQMSDMYMARRVGAKGVFLGRIEEGGGREPDFATAQKNFYEAVRWILEDSHAG